MKVAVYAATMLLTLPWLPCTTGGNDPVLDSPFCQYTPKQCMQYVAAYHNVTDAEPASLWYERAGYSRRASPPELCRLVASSFRASEVKARHSTKEDSHSAGRTNTSSLLHDSTLVGRGWRGGGGRWVDERLIERYRAEHAPIDRSVVRRAVAQKRAEAAAERHEPARRWPEWEALAEVRALHTGTCGQVGGGVVLPPCG